MSNSMLLAIYYWYVLKICLVEDKAGRVVRFQSAKNKGQ